MKHLRILIPLITLSFVLAACSSDDDDPQPSGGNTVVNNNKNDASVQPEVAGLEFPRLKGGTNNVLIVHKASFGVNYCVEWDSDLRPEGWDGQGSLRAQRWTCYQMHKGNSSKKTDRKPRDTSSDFSEYPNDRDLDSRYHFTNDPYWGSGYDHGHIIASADRAYSFNSAANIQTFYMTNMQPQVNGFNAGVWQNMEKFVREQAKASTKKEPSQIGYDNLADTLYVCKGGTIDSEANIAGYIGSGSNRIPVPKYFYMALLCKNAQGYKAMAFWIQHKAGNDDGQALKQYVVSIDELEQKTGIDFFCNLPDDIEEKVESNAVANAWGFK